MSHIMILRMNADRDTFERVAEEQKDSLQTIEAASHEAGAIHHAFCVDGEGRVVVIDEWDSPDSFQRFFESEGERIGPLMAAAGVQGEPQIEFYEKLDTGDSF